MEHGERATTLSTTRSMYSVMLIFAHKCLGAGSLDLALIAG
jgi:hypothetical protein